MAACPGYCLCRNLDRSFAAVIFTYSYKLDVFKGIQTCFVFVSTRLSHWYATAVLHTYIYGGFFNNLDRTAERNGLYT